MNKLLKLSALFVVLILSACSSDDEPEPEYTGPWEIVYDESYYGLHNDSQDFREWFINHSQYLEAAQLQKLNGATWTITDKDFRLSDYDEWYSGRIRWYQIVDNSSEQDIIDLVETFNSFTIEDRKNNTHDSFKAQYRRYERHQ